MSTNTQIKGDETERIAGLYLWNRNYLVLTNIIVFTNKLTGTGNYTFTDVTDIDTLGIKFDSLENEHSYYIDCKSRNQSLFKQLIWSFGVKNLLNFSDLLVIRDSVPEIAQNFSNEYQIRILNKSFLIKNTKEVQHGLFSSKNYHKRNEIIKNLDKQDIKIRKFFFGTFLKLDPFGKLKSLIRLNKENRPKSNLVMFEIFELTLLSIFKLASSVSHLYYTDHLKSYLMEGLIGDYEFKKKVDNIINTLISHQYDETNINRFLPSYFDKLVSIIINIIKEPMIVQDLLRYNNFCFYEFGMNGIFKVDFKLLDKLNIPYKKLEFSKINSAIINILIVNDKPLSFLEPIAKLLT